MRLVPLTVTTAREFCRQHHRTHRHPVGGLWALGALVDTQLVGVALVGRPVARLLNDGLTAELTRLCVLEAHRNVGSFLLGAVRRVAQTMGYRRVVTYTLAREGGASLRGAGWEPLAHTPGGSWSRRARPRSDPNPTDPKVRWEAVLHE